MKLHGDVLTHFEVLIAKNIFTRYHIQSLMHKKMYFKSCFNMF